VVDGQNQVQFPLLQLKPVTQGLGISLIAHGILLRSARFLMFRYVDFNTVGGGFQWVSLPAEEGWDQ
jgi:hypothetical protein